MSYMAIAVGAVGIATVLLIGYYIIGNVIVLNDGLSINDTNFTNSFNQSKTVVIAGFGLVAIGVIVVAAFGLVNVFK